MHPIERLRFVARASGADPATLVQEAAAGLAAFSGDPVGLVTACRRVVDRQPSVGPLWWLCSRLLTTNTDPRSEGRAVVMEMMADETASHAADSLPDGGTIVLIGWPAIAGEVALHRGDCLALVVDMLGEGTGLVRRLRRAGADVEEVRPSGLATAVQNAAVVLLEASAIGPDAAWCVAGSHAAAAVAYTAGVPVWLLGGVGRQLPARLWDSLVKRLDGGETPWDADDEAVPLGLISHIVNHHGLLTVPEALAHTDCPIAPELLRQTAF